MTDAVETRIGTPWHLWLVGGIGLLWNGFGGYDYVMSQMQGEAYLRASGMNDAQIAHFNAMPAWMVADWAIGVWGSVLGTVLLLARSRFATPAFVASLAGLLVSVLYHYVLSGGGALMGPIVLVMDGVISAGLVFFIVYAQRMAKAGVLR